MWQQFKHTDITLLQHLYSRAPMQIRGGYDIMHVVIRVSGYSR
jgi:hypothetical protein